MAIANYLQEIKAAGIYRFIFDKSQLPAQDRESLRLVVGYSEKGPFNTPVFVETASDFKKIYGDVSKKLERYGDFFHRSALQALEAGPIFALNVKNFTDPNEENEDANAGTDSGNGTDRVNGVTFDKGNFAETTPYHVTDIYDKTRFWYLEPKNLRTKDTKYITLAATDSKSVSNSVFIRAYKPKGYNITFKEWYASVMNGEELPSYLEGYEEYRGDFVSRENGSLVADRDGEAVAYAIFNLEPRGKMFIVPGDEFYKGMVVGERNKSKDLEINPSKAKKLSNMRAAGKDENIILTPVQPMTIEKALDFIADDELVEITPNHVRIRKKEL